MAEKVQVIYVQSAGEDERRNSKTGKNGGMCRERSNFLGELAEYLMEAECLSRCPRLVKENSFV